MWGNPKLITWDYGKELTLNLEDALLSPESLKVMVGGEGVSATTTNGVNVRFTSQTFTTGTSDTNISNSTYLPNNNILIDTYQTKHYFGNSNRSADKNYISILDMTDGVVYQGTNIETYNTNINNGHTIRLFWVEEVKSGTDSGAYEVTINSSTFPGTYQFVGDTFFTPESGSEKIPYQWIIYKGKISSEVTFTMEAEGDPATFSFTVNALRNKDNKLMEWIQYYTPSDNT